MTIKGRHNRIDEEAAWATRRDLFAARAQSGNWVLAYVAPDRIDPNPNQPRRQLERAALEELKQSIAARGILQPLLGAKSSESRVQLVAGHRRLQAAKELGLARVPVVLVDGLKAEDTVIDAVIENIQRRNLEAWEEGVAYAQLADEFGWTHEEIGRKIGKSRPYVSTRIRAAEKLSPEVKEFLVTGNWTAFRPALGTSVPASEEFHNQGVVDIEKATSDENNVALASLNNIEVIRRLTTLSREQQNALLLEIYQRLDANPKLSVKEVIALIKSGRTAQPAELTSEPGDDEGYQLSFVDLGLEELNLFHRWTRPDQPEKRGLSVEELDRLIDLYEKDLSKLRRVRAEKSSG